VPFEHLAYGALNQPGFCTRSGKCQFAICIPPPSTKQATTHYLATELTNDITGKFSKTYTKRKYRTPLTTQATISLPSTLLQTSWQQIEGAVICNELLCILYQSATEFLSKSNK
jgi:hypothetical protein